MSGFVYKISSTVGDKVYIGSTQERLNQRFNRHKKTKNTTVVQLFDEYGVDTCSIHMMEYVEFKEKKELLHRERYWIENTPNCVNIKKPIETEEEEKERKKRHYERVKDDEDRKERAKQASKTYYENHTEQLREKSRLYNQTHPEKRKELFKGWYEKVKETEAYKEKQRIKMERGKEVVLCECGKTYTLYNKSRHMKSHQ